MKTMIDTISDFGDFATDVNNAMAPFGVSIVYSDSRYSGRKFSGITAYVWKL